MKIVYWLAGLFIAFYLWGLYWNKTHPQARQYASEAETKTALAQLTMSLQALGTPVIAMFGTLPLTGATIKITNPDIQNEFNQYGETELFPSMIA